MSAIQEHWDAQAAKGDQAGTRDRLASQLEAREISKWVEPTDTVLDFGCGLGDTLASLRPETRRQGRVGIDFAAKMIRQARKRHPNLTFIEGGLDQVALAGPFSIIYTQRCLINLPSIDEQVSYINTLRESCDTLVCVECSQQGLARLNVVRCEWGLEKIVPPWHNLYLDEEIIRDETGDGLIMDAHDFSSTYYYVSRVINAYQAQHEGREPDYEAPINQKAAHEIMRCAPSGCGQVRLWVWAGTSQ